MQATTRGPDVSSSRSRHDSTATSVDASDAWLKALDGTGSVHDGAVDALHALLLQAACSEVGRRRCAHDSEDDIVTQAASVALQTVLAKLDDFHGASRFTRWACKFALLEAAVLVRRHDWRRREVALDSDSWTRLTEQAAGPDVIAEDAEVLRALATGIGDLTTHQRRVLVSLTIDAVPIDVLAERLNTTRGALYETMRVARGKLRAALVDSGLPIDVS